MKCEECNTSALEEFLDGEFDQGRAAEMSAHLASCQECALRYDALLNEGVMYGSYERDIEVTPQEMWSGIAARIAATPEKPFNGSNPLQKIRAWLMTALVAPRFSPVLTAAMMLLAIGATAIVMRYMESPIQPSPQVAAGTTTPTPEQVKIAQPSPEATPIVVPTATQNGGPSGAAKEQSNEREKKRQPEPQRKRDAERKPPLPANNPAPILVANQNGEQLRRQRVTEKLVRDAEAKYLAAIKMLSEDVNRKRTRLDPQVAARFDETLATIDRSIAETRRTVLQQRSNDPVAVQYMLSAYAKKVEVMREMAAVD